MVSVFTSSLRADIQTAVLVHKPKTLYEAFELTHTHEQCLLLEWVGLFKPVFRNFPPLLPSPNSYPPNVLCNRPPIKRLRRSNHAEKRGYASIVTRSTLLVINVKLLHSYCCSNAKQRHKSPSLILL